MSTSGNYRNSSNRGKQNGRGYYGNRGRSWWRGRGRGRGTPVATPCGTPVVTPQPCGTPVALPSCTPVATPPRRPHLIQTTLTDHAYSHWSLYLDREGSTAQVVKMIKEFEKYFVTHLEEYTTEDIDIHRSIPINYSDLIHELQYSLPDLSTDIRDTPELILNCLALAFHTTIDANSSVVCEGGDDSTSNNTSRYNIRLYGLEPLTVLKNVKAPLYGKCISLTGTVVRVSSVKPLVTSMGFTCIICQERQSFSFIDGKYSIPTKCTGQECHSKLFSPLRRSEFTKTIDSQTIKLQEQVDDDRREAGRIPRTIECELTGDLVDSCVPGDVVTVTAVVKATGSHDDGRPKSSKDKCTFLLYLYGISVINRNRSESVQEGREFTTKDLYAVQEIHSDKNVFRLLVNSLAPTIYGHEIVKAGLLLALFGGRQDFTDQQTSLTIRGNPHVLVVGDPGLGKSQMLQSASNVAPRGVYVCGNTTTSSGLTVTLCKEPSSNEYSLEAGALVLGDQGCCCIDEFDKMGSQHSALLEAMEQQSISIAKAGIVCTLPARTSILAAANPSGGHYNKGKTVSENLKMNSALLSRFDLVFILLDKPDQEFDSVLSEHVMSLHYKRNVTIQSAVARRSPQSINQSLVDQSMLSTDLTLIDKLRNSKDDSFDPIPVPLLRKYISYARTYVHPRLNSEGSTVLQQFYLQLRKQQRKGDSTPITTRQLESLIRLTEARARLELRDIAGEQDAKDVVEIMKYSMSDTYSDEYGLLDYSRCQNGSGMSQKGQAQNYIKQLGNIAESKGEATFTWNQLKEVSQMVGLKVKSFDDFIFSLNNQGYLIKKGRNLYKLQTVYD